MKEKYETTVIDFAFEPCDSHEGPWGVLWLFSGVFVCPWRVLGGSLEQRVMRFSKGPSTEGAKGMGRVRGGQTLPGIGGLQGLGPQHPCIHTP